MNEFKNFAKNLKYLRTANGLTQDDLAVMLNYKSSSTIQKWESETIEPSIRVATMVAKLFNVDLMEFCKTDITDKPVPLMSRDLPEKEAKSSALSVSLDRLDEIASRLEAYLAILNSEVVNKNYEKLTPENKLVIAKQIEFLLAQQQD